jgi:hypothetical protein
MLDPHTCVSTCFDLQSVLTCFDLQSVTTCFDLSSMSNAASTAVEELLAELAVVEAENVRLKVHTICDSTSRECQAQGTYHMRQH